MNAKERNRLIGAIETYLPMEFREPIIRGVGLLAAAEANDGTTPETAAAQIILWQNDETGRTSWQKTQPGPNWYRVGTPALCLLEDARRLESERNGLAARVAELEKDVRRLDWLASNYAYVMGYADGPEKGMRLISDPTGAGNLRAAIDAARSKP